MGIVVISLGVTAVGSALGGPEAQTSVSKKKVKKIAKKEAKKEGKKTLRKAKREDAALRQQLGASINQAKQEANQGIAEAKQQASDALAAAIEQSDAVTASNGETKTVYDNGEFSFRLKCDESGSNPRATLDLVAGVGGVVYTAGQGGGGFLAAPGDSTLWALFNASFPAAGSFDFHILVPSGKTYFGNAAAGVNVAGADCAAWVTAIT